MLEKKNHRNGNRSVARALAILNLLASRSEPLGVREIARQLSLAQHRAAPHQDARARWLPRADRDDIALRNRVQGLPGRQHLRCANHNLRSAVLPELYALADQQINAFLGVMRDASIRLPCDGTEQWACRDQSSSGRAQTHLHSTAMGKSLLAEMSDDEVRALLSRSPLPRLTPKTKISVSQLLAELETIRQQGYSVSEEENRLDFFSIGAVIRDATGAAVAVISGAVPTAGLKNQDRARSRSLSFRLRRMSRAD